MDKSINLRLEKFLYEKEITQEQLKIKLGLKTRQQVSNWVNCHDPIPDKYILAILHAYPELNANWLIRDIGEMYLDQATLSQANRNKYGFCENCLEKEKEIKILNKRIEKLENTVKDNYIEIGKMKERYEKNKPSQRKNE